MRSDCHASVASVACRNTRCLSLSWSCRRQHTASPVCFLLIMRAWPLQLFHSPLVWLLALVALQSFGADEVATASMVTPVSCVMCISMTSGLATELTCMVRMATVPWPARLRLVVVCACHMLQESLLADCRTCWGAAPPAAGADWSHVCLSVKRCAGWAVHVRPHLQKASARAPAWSTHEPAGAGACLVHMTGAKVASDGLLVTLMGALAIGYALLLAGWHGPSVQLGAF